MIVPTNHNYMREKEPTYWELAKYYIRLWSLNFVILACVAVPIGIAAKVIWRLILFGFNLL